MKTTRITPTDIVVLLEIFPLGRKHSALWRTGLTTIPNSLAFANSMQTHQHPPRREPILLALWKTLTDQPGGPSE
jgi:hypothetical protein